MHYMLLLYVEDRPQPGAPGAGEYYQALMAFHAHCRERGVLVSSAPLDAPSAAATVRVRQGKVLRTDGPFAETTEWLGGYFLLDCRDEQEAVKLAELCPISREGSVEVRAVWDRAGARAS
jgi:hypothetical protein